MIKNGLAISIPLLMFIGSAYAAACQYADMVNVSTQIPVVTVDGQTFYGAPVTATNFVHKSIGQHLTFTCLYQDSFDLVNQLPIPVTVQVSYTLQGGLNQTIVTIPASGTQTISAQYMFEYWNVDCINNRNLGPPQLDFSSVKIAYQIGQLKMSTVTRYNQTRVCRECPPDSGQICLNDGVYAGADYLCGSGIRDANEMCVPNSTGLNRAISNSVEAGQNLLIEIIIVIILIIFLWVALTGKPPSHGPDTIIGIWHRD